MERACMYCLIFALMTGCAAPHGNKADVSSAETVLTCADSLERTSTVYADTATLQQALRVFTAHERTQAVAKTHYHLGNAYKALGEDSLAFDSYAQAADLFLAASDSVYYPLSVLEMSLIAERRYNEDGNATMLHAIRTLQRRIIHEKVQNNRWKSLWWLLLLVVIAGVGTAGVIIWRRKPVSGLAVTREDLDRNIELVLSQGSIIVTLHWRDYPEFCRTANAYLYNTVDRLQTASPQLSEQDIRFLILVLLDLPAKEIAGIMSLSQNSISNKKTRTAQKLGTIAADLRETIIRITLKTKEK
ncbi:MAG: hypothetical protein IJT12_07660 [Paludibacteraceae bacterium]|nr:hypothetical protein [Paludibacteraceae bacterium]